MKAIALILLGAAFGLSAHQMGMTTGRQNALKEAYRTNPVSEELEFVCAGLWIGEQNRKYWAKEQSK